MTAQPGQRIAKRTGRRYGCRMSEIGAPTTPVVGGRKARAIDNTVRSAMLSVYYQTVGRQFEIRGAPSIVLPPEVPVMSLEDALGVLSTSPTRLREALWRMVQSVPLNAAGNSNPPLGYPAALVRCLKSGGYKLNDLIDLRREFRRGANIFAAALIACRDDDIDGFRDLLRVLQARVRPSSGVDFSDAMVSLLGVQASEYLLEMESSFAGPASKKLVQQITRIESEIGCGISDFVERLADVAAFDKFMPAKGHQEGAPTRVYPVCSIIQQDTQSLITTATVTTVVHGEFERLCRVIDPANWAETSLVVSTSDYIAGPLDPVSPTPEPVFGEEYKYPDGRHKPLFLNEIASIAWDGNSDQQATFHNVLNILTSVRRSRTDVSAGDPDSIVGRDEQSAKEDQVSLNLNQADVVYNLCRSIDSRFLWDQRAGGILLNQGFIKLRELGNDNWRVTMRKQLKFSDRTPYENGLGLRDFGQLANYLAPATLTWWLECETYGLADDSTVNRPAEAAGTATIEAAATPTTPSLEGNDG